MVQFGIKDRHLWMLAPRKYGYKHKYRHKYKYKYRNGMQHFEKNEDTTMIGKNININICSYVKF